MPTIIIIINRLYVGGAERLVVDDINEMLRRGINVNLITLFPESSKSFQNECDISCEKWHVLSFKSLFDLHNWIRIIKIIKSIHPNIVITHLWFANTVGRISALLSFVPKIISFEHNVYDEVKSNKQFIVDRLLQYISNKIIAVSDSVKDSLVKHGITESRVSVVMNGLNLNRYIRNNGTSLRKKMNIKNDDFVFLFVGRLTHQKGVDILIDAFSIFGDGKLIIVGDGEDREYLINKSKRLNVYNDIFFLGVRHDVVELLYESDCFVLPSRWEGVGLVVLEAIATKRPIIVSDFNAVNEILEEDDCTIIVEKENITDLCNAMVKMKENTFSEECKRGSMEKFSITKHVDILLSYSK